MFHWSWSAFLLITCSGEKGDSGSNRPPGDPHSSQHHCSQHPDQRCLRANQPADQREKAASRCQTAEVCPPLPQFLFVLSSGIGIHFVCLLWNYLQEHLQRNNVSFTGGLGTREHWHRWGYIVCFTCCLVFKVICIGIFLMLVKVLFHPGDILKLGHGDRT